uniref:Insulinase (Peptidase family m16) family protein isoform 2 n=1 Tax=Tetraselmis sp. GSL018 TaxID=582737 RepID=A0A061SA19_9CHLO
MASFSVQAVATTAGPWPRNASRRIAYGSRRLTNMSPTKCSLRKSLRRGALRTPTRDVLSQLRCSRLPVQSISAGNQKFDAPRGNDLSSRWVTQPLWRPKGGLFVSSRRGRQMTLLAAIVNDSTEAASLLSKELPKHPDLVQGQLDNGMKYVILPNAVPPQRFEAHLEVHVGSVDEKEDEQGMAHIVEHVTFLGSKKRDSLLGTGARSNAYTDFHHTVFHVHSPQTNITTGNRMLPQVMEVLREIAFEPQFLASRIEKERRAVLAEAQMMNTIEYRVDCQLLRYLHEENALGYRFPIGKTDQIKRWPGDKLRAFHKRWYFPANTTLYVVGELDGGVEGTVALIESTFGGVPAGREDPPAGEAPAPSAGNGDQAEAPLGPLKHRHELRPPVEHRMGVGPVEGGAGHAPAPVSIFRHSLLQYFMLSILCKVPVQPVKTFQDMKYMFMVRIMLSVLQFRLSSRYTEGNPPFIAIDLDHSDSAREGCAVSTLTITSEPKDWRGAVSVAQQEVRRLQQFGVTRSELERYRDVLLRDSAQMASQAESIPSVDNLDFVMENLALSHVVMDHKQGHEVLVRIADSITIEETNAVARSLLSFVSHYGKEDQAAAEAEASPEEWMQFGATRATSIVACIPAFMDESGHSTGGGMPLTRGASLTTTEHVDVSANIDSVSSDEDEDPDAEEVPEGAVRFDITAEDIQQALMEDSVEVEAMEEIDVPDHLVPEEELQRLMLDLRPTFVPLEGPGATGEVLAPTDPHTGITQRRLSNGITVNYRHTTNEPRGAMLRLTACGGRSCESGGASPGGIGAISIGTRTLSESGAVGSWRREQVELFCISKLVNCVLEASDEMIFMDFHFPVTDGGMDAMFELLHLFIREPRWEDSAMERSKQIFLSHYRSLPKSLERATADRLIGVMLGNDRRFMDANPQEIEALTLEGMRRTVMDQIVTSNLEISIVGDFDESSLDDKLLKYLGTIPPSARLPNISCSPLTVQTVSPELQHQQWHLKDSDERAIAIIAGPAPGRWNAISRQMIQAGATQESLAAGQIVPPLDPEAAAQTPDAAASIRRAHPLYSSVTLMLLSEIINSRLFTTVRDALGLTYDVSFELTLFERLSAGWFFVTVTSTPEKIHEAKQASVNVLLNVAYQPITPRELQRAKRTLLTRHESDQKDNAYWLSLLTHLQAPSVPSKRLECLRDLRAMYEAATLEDVYEAFSYLRLDEQSVFTCVGTSGKTAPPPPPQAAAPQGAAPAGNGQPAEMDTSAMFAALAQAARNVDLGRVMQTLQEKNQGDKPQ